MKLANYIYRSALEGGNSLKARFFQRARRLFLRLGDPDCDMEAHGRILSMPLSHTLPWHRLKHPCYDALPERLAAFIRERDGELRAIDIGANIGDTIAALHLDSEDAVLAVEPAPGFVRFLRENWSTDNRVTIVEAICSSEKREDGFVIEENDGTARIRKDSGEGKASPEIRTLDEILEESPENSDPNLIKVDTDGHDFEVIAGGTEVIERSHPAVFLECDAFDNSRYLDDFQDTMAAFDRAGYSGMLVYDNFGYLMGRFSLDQLDAFEQLLVYQVTSEFFYFDLLLIHDSDDLEIFHQDELRFFAGRIGEPEFRANLQSKVASRELRTADGRSVELAG